jgi:hypothetical protein
MAFKKKRSPRAIPWRHNRASRRAHLQPKRPKMTREEAWAWAESLADPNLPSVLATSIPEKST